MVDSLKDVTLKYFPFNGRGAVVRMLLLKANIPFKNEIIEFKDWPSVKPNLELQFIPVLQVGNNTYTQSQAIFFYLARKIGNLLGSNFEDEFEIIMILNLEPDLYPFLNKVVRPKENEKDAETMKKNFNDLISKFEIVFNSLNSRYEKHGSGKYFLGDKISLADYLLAHYLGSVTIKLCPEVGTALRPKFVNLYKYYDSLLDNEFKDFYSSEYYYPGMI